MAGKITAAFALFTVAAFLANLGFVQCSPAIASSYDSMAVCIENCAQCKRMLGSWFDGPLCAESCIEYMGKRIPDCEDFSSIKSFVTKL